MMIKAYLDWSQNASAQDRAEAVAMLAEVYLDAELSHDDRRDAEAALTLALEDISPLVRQAMAVALGGSDRAPRHIIAALARDQVDVAATVLANSPMLSAPELAEHAAFGVPTVQRAIASRPHVPAALSAVLADGADVETALVLLDNPGAELDVASLHRLVEKHAGDGGFREAMLAHGDLTAVMQLKLAEAAARQLSTFAQTCGWMPEARATRVCREATEAAAIRVAQDADSQEMQRLAERLRLSGQMTPQLLMRAVLSGEIRLFAAALADLAEVDPARAQGFVLGRSMMGFGALYRKAGLPGALEPAFAAAVAAWQELSRGMNVTEGRLSRVMIEMVLSGVALLQGAEVDRLRALLMTFQSEAAREEARLRIADIRAADAVVITAAEEPDVDVVSLGLEAALAEELRLAA